MSELHNIQKIAASAMHAQSARLRIISENLANASSTSQVPGGDPYQRKTISFKSEFDPKHGTELLAVSQIGRDTTPFHRAHRPGDPGADAEGYVKLTNVNSLMEMMDLREASRSYEANLKIYETSTVMEQRTLDILRS